MSLGSKSVKGVSIPAIKLSKASPVLSATTSSMDLFPAPACCKSEVVLSREIFCRFANSSSSESVEEFATALSICWLASAITKATSSFIWDTSALALVAAASIMVSNCCVSVRFRLPLD